MALAPVQCTTRGDVVSEEKNPITAVLTEKLYMQWSEKQTLETKKIWFQCDLLHFLAAGGPTVSKRFNSKAQVCQVQVGIIMALT